MNGALPPAVKIAADASVAAARGDDHAGADQQVANVDGGVEVSARIVAEVEHQAAHVVGRQPRQRLLQFVGRLVGEAADADVADPIAAFEEEVPGAVGVAGVAQHGGYLNDLADELDFLRFLFALVQDGERDRLAGLAAQQGHGVAQRHPWVPALPIRRIRSPARMPALEAGEPTSGLRTISCLVSGSIASIHAHAAELEVDGLPETPASRRG